MPLKTVFMAKPDVLEFVDRNPGAAIRVEAAYA
jgi:hypothetical protein